MEHKTSYKQELLILGYNKTSVEQQIRNINNFFKITQKEIQEVKPSDIKNFVKHFKSKQLHSSTIRSCYNHIEKYFIYLEREQNIKKNPFNYYQLELSKDKHTIREILTQQEITQLYNKANAQETIILHLCYGCGLRAFEMEQITLNDIDFEQKTVTVQKGKYSKYRVIPLSEKINQDLFNYLQINQHNTMKQQNILYNKAGTKLKQYTALAMMKKLAQKANIKANVTLHGLRHSIATHLLENGVNLTQIQQFLGHKQMETTEIYTRIRKQQLQYLVISDK